MVSLMVLPEGDPAGFPSDKDFQELSADDLTNVVVEWFFHNYEDPVHNTPFESAEGGYQYIWGGPYDAIDRVSSRFSRLVSHDIIEAAVEEIEQREGPLWTASARRVVPDGSDNEDNQYRGDWTNDTPTSPEAARQAVSSDLTAFETALQTLLSTSPGIGHNHPPDAIADPPFSPSDLIELRAIAADIKVEVASDKPKSADLRRYAVKLADWAKRVLEWAAKKADLFAEEAAKSAGRAVGPILVTGAIGLVVNYFGPAEATMFEKAAKLGESVSYWAEKLHP